MATQNNAARDVTRYHYGKNLVYFPSRKNNCQVICESLLEADLCLLLEYDNHVIHYECQPETLRLPQLGARSVYTPDFLVETEDARIYIEVKPDRNQLSNRYLEKLLTAKSIFQQRGHTLHLVDVTNIRSRHKLRNLQLLYSRSFNVTPSEYANFTSRARTLPQKLTLGALLQDSPYISSSTKYLSIFKGDLSVDLEKPLTLTTPVEVKIS